MKTAFCRRFLCFLLGFAFAFPAFAQEVGGGDFVIQDIRIEGLRRFSPGAIFSKLPVDIGDELTSERTVEIIDSLYETGFFRAVDVLRDGDVLVIRVDENPTIAEVTVSGADELSDSALESLLQGANIAKARVFDRNVLDQAARAIEAAYVERNFYEARVVPVISPLPRNRVAILFNVDEGTAAAIRSIRLIGNDAFSTWRLRRTMRLESRGLLNFFGDNYLYSRQKLSADISRVRTLYLEEGYLNVDVSEVVEVSEDKRSINILLYFDEGERYVVSDIDIKLAEDSPPLPFDPDEEFRRFVTQEEGDLYNGRAANETVSDIRAELGKLGRANARVSFTPDLNDDTGMVRVVFEIDPGAIVYVRRIDIIGNEFTADEVIRRELLQFERERYSAEKINRSRSRIRRLGYFNSVNIETLPVDDSPDEVDLVIRLDETYTGEVRLGAGFESAGGLSYNAGFSNNNIFGGGNDFSAAFSKTEDSLSAEVELEEKYHTKDGVTRHIAMTYGEERAADDASDYSIDGFHGEYGYSWPFTDDGSYRLYLAYRRVNIDNADGLNPEYRKFIDRHDDRFDSLYFIAGARYDTRDAANLPKEGQNVNINGEFSPPLLELKYYYLSYSHEWYREFKDLPTDPVLRARLGGGYGDSYGDGEYPFYRRFLLGGTSTLRGFSTNSIGHKDDESGNAIGGKSRLYGSLEMSADARFFLFEDQQVFLVPFIDAGAVGENIGLGSARASWGLEFRWRSPIGPLRFSYVEILKSRSSDNTENFQFSVSTF